MNARQALNPKPDLLEAIIYCRVSSPAQVRRGHGLQSQETRCRDYAAAQGYAVAAVFPDDAWGGGDFMDHPGMVALLSFLRAQPHRSYIVIFDDLKRFARDTEFHIRLRRELNAVGARVECLNFKFEDTPEGEFIETIMAAQGELERKQNRRQVIQKMKARVQAGYYLFAPAYGYRYEKVPAHGKILVPDEPAASVVREAFEGLASGRFTLIGDVKGFLEEVSDLPRNRHGEIRWSGITEMMMRPLYAGLIDVPKWGIEKLPGKHERLVSYETWSRAQDVLDGRALAPARKDINADFPMRGFVHCGDCGHALTAGWSKSRSGRKHPYYLCGQKTCSSKRKSIRRAAVEGEVEDILQTLTPGQGLFDLCADMLRDAWAMLQNEGAARRARLKRDAQDTQGQIDKLLDRLVDADSENIVTIFERRIEWLEHDKRLIEERVQKAVAPAKGLEETFELTLRFLSSPWKIYEKGQLDLRRTVLKLVFCEPLTYDRMEGLRTAKKTYLSMC